MRRSLTGLSITAALSTCFAGCSLVQPAKSDVRPALTPETRLEALKDVEAFFAESEAAVSTLDPQQLQAGQHIQISTGGVPMPHFPELIVDSTTIAGTVKEVSADRAVLQDVVMISARPTQQGVPVAGKLPYFGRLFKNSSAVRRVVTPVPGEVAIELSEILHAKELTDTAFEQVRKYGVERIGLDFDFSAAEGDAAKIQQ